MPRKKNLQVVENPVEIEPESSPSSPPIAPPIAQQTHRIVTTYKKEIPLEEVETGLDDEEFEEEPELIEPAPAPVEPSYPDSISQMLADLQIERRQHTWIMIVERLPNYEKDNRHDVQSKRINCGTRPMSTDFIEDIRREFARPGKANHFRVTIKRDGKIFAHWPEVISLEPPPLDEIVEYEAKTQPAPIYNFPAPTAAPSFKQMLDQFKQLAELRSVLFPESMQNPVLARPEPLTEEAALMKLITSNGDVIDRFSKQLSKKLFREEAADPETSWLLILKSALDNGPGIVRELFTGLAKMRAEAVPIDAQALPVAPGGAPMPAAVAVSEPAAAPINNPPEKTPPPPELLLLSNVLRFAEMNAPPEAAARWVDEFTAQVPVTNPLIEMFLAMTPAECITFLNQYFHEAQSVTNRPDVAEWIKQLQKALTKPEEGETE